MSGRKQWLPQHLHPKAKEWPHQSKFWQTDNFTTPSLSLRLSPSLPSQPNTKRDFEFINFMGWQLTSCNVCLRIHILYLYGKGVFSHSLRMNLSHGRWLPTASNQGFQLPWFDVTGDASQCFFEIFNHDLLWLCAKWRTLQVKVANAYILMSNAIIWKKKCAIWCVYVVGLQMYTERNNRLFLFAHACVCALICTYAMYM